MGSSYEDAQREFIAENSETEEGENSNELEAAYRELWAAVENGSLDKDFFKLRERFRNACQKPGPVERTWNTWVLSEEDIEQVAKDNEIDLSGRDLDEIARRFEKGVSSLLGSSGYDWTDILDEAIRNTEQWSTSKRKRG